MDQNTEYTNLQPGIQATPIVPIGGSARSQQVLSKLISHIPGNTGLAYVYTQHLSSKYNSQNEVILSAKTSIRVLNAAHLTPLQAGEVYVIPPIDMEIVNGVLLLITRNSSFKIHGQVDQFFNALTERQKDAAICIMLSGMASDSTKRLRAIKVTGGIATIAQDNSAAVKSMPQSAVSEGEVDIMLSPREIVPKLVRLSKHARILGLKQQVLHQIISTKTPMRPVRIKAAGCSTGQEAYSLAIIFNELIGAAEASLPIQIFTTDLSDTAIAKAQTGLYIKNEVSKASFQRLERFFTKSDEQFGVNKEVRNFCVFAPHNVLSDPPFARMDLISCRNFLIYLDEDLHTKVFCTFHCALRPNGYLILGKSESMGRAPILFAQIIKKGKRFLSAKITARPNFTWT